MAPKKITFAAKNEMEKCNYNSNLAWFNKIIYKRLDDFSDFSVFHIGLLGNLECDH